VGIASTRAQLRAHHRHFVFRRAFAQFVEAIEADLEPSRNVLRRLIYGWGNEGWSASEAFLSACVRESLACRHGTILECGSGLTTLLVGAIADRRDLEFVSLEHMPEWREHVMSCARTVAIHRVRVELAPLQDYDGYFWYSIPASIRPPISLVLCDGPPGDTPGGRYGLIPAVRHLLHDRCVILLDDAIREDEQVIARRWQQDVSVTCQLIDETPPYFRILFQRRRSPVAARTKEPDLLRHKDLRTQLPGLKARLQAIKRAE
jgi:hypothetical protein